MSKIIMERSGNIAVLRLNNGVTNGICQDMVDDLSKAIERIRNEFEGMVLAGGTKFFCMGLDLQSLLKLNRIEMTDFWYNFNRVIFDIFTISLPTVCVLSGHAVAGGNILALACDYRFGTTDKKKIGLNEVKLGLPVPYLPDIILRQIVGDRAATEMVYTGEFISFEDAKRLGLIDEIYPPEIIEARAIQKVRDIAGFYRPAFSAIKDVRVEEIRLKYEKNFKAKTEILLDCWFSEPVMKLLEEASRKF